MTFCDRATPPFIILSHSNEYNIGSFVVMFVFEFLNTFIIYLRTELIRFFFSKQVSVTYDSDDATTWFSLLVLFQVLSIRSCEDFKLKKNTRIIFPTC